MKDVWQTIAELAAELHPDRLGAAAEKIKDLDSPSEFYRAKSLFGPGADKSLVDSLGELWAKDRHLSSMELAAALRGASSAAQLMERREAIEMVWTGPFTGLVASRHTEQVLLEVITYASKRLILVSFVAYDINTILKAMKDAASRNVKIDILLERSKSHGGKVDIDSIDALRKENLAANVYTWNHGPKSKRTLEGAIHAKCAVADGSLAFITSANLTSAAMERNMELGVLIRGGDLPDKLMRHLEALISTGIVERV